MKVSKEGNHWKVTYEDGSVSRHFTEADAKTHAKTGRKVHSAVHSAAKKAWATRRKRH